ncbi:MAG: nucleotidyltransferase family protein [Bacteroidaceae bacterium]
MQTPTTRQFLALLRVGLWQQPVDESCFADASPDWAALFRMAADQTVSGLVYDGINALPPHLYPPTEWVMRWCASAVRIEQANERVDRALAALSAFYCERGIRPVLLKGQGVARLYPEPGHRQCGDIDFYLGAHYGRAKQLLQAEGFRLGSEGEKHVDYVCGGVAVENHRYAAVLYHPGRNRRFQRWADAWLSEKGTSCRIKDEEVTLPPPGFNAVYLLVHALLHFIPEGIGLRQVCDWARLLYVCRESIDRERLCREVRALGLEEAFVTFGYVAVRHLGLPPECVPFSLEGADEAGEFLLDDILQGGNFGHARPVNRLRQEGGWAKHWHNYRAIRSRCREMRLFCRAEARWYPYFRAWNLLKKKLRGLD